MPDRVLRGRSRTTGRRLRTPWLLTLSGLVALLAGGLQGADAAPGKSRTPPETTWAHVHAATGVRAKPTTRSRVIARVSTSTYLGRPEVVVVKGRGGKRGAWTRVRFPQRGSRLGWVPTATLGPVRQAGTRIVIDRARQRLTVFRGSKRVRRFAVGIGAPGSPTPRGRFYVREKLVVRPAQPVYGPRAIGLSSHSPYRTSWPGGGQVGIHGTNEPVKVPGRPSNGCVRLRNRDVRVLYRLVEIGSPVVVR